MSEPSTRLNEVREALYRLGERTKAQEEHLNEIYNLGMQFANERDAAQALAESGSLTLATMREAIQNMIETAPNVTMRGNGVDRVAVGFDQFVALTQIVKQPADDAAALAGAVLDAAAEMASPFRGEKIYACRICRSTWRIEAPEHHQDIEYGVLCPVVAYRRARSALRGHGAAEG